MINEFRGDRRYEARKYHLDHIICNNTDHCLGAYYCFIVENLCRPFHRVEDRWYGSCCDHICTTVDILTAKITKISKKESI